ncbi:DsbA family oxidoreductase [Allonocardiopsis opalescens]|uniref:Putative DsbA family dithiol-disulfide isomerase n=1 Tax=Allonocardiopsis opalescens TaxID=1144618 RepID=A0A2T0PZ20_9ACTN|nr:DsbA family oxidoreductase [Allonocardiopsis opalescens]PRX96771.1 putative DsbA family dithiol-disulfide isomerase [Allonocardiopsis opalescens]
MSDAIKVDVWSDVQCPWCYIGKRKFEAGAARFGGEVEVEYHSFELAPDTPEDFDGSALDFLVRRKGMPPEQVRQMLDRVTAIAASVGLEYDFDSVHQTKTLKAHELLHHAKAEGRQLDMKERLLRAYFVEGAHVGRAEGLADLAADIGLDRGAALAALAEGTYREAVRADIELAQRYGIRGVPFYVLDAKYGVSGAQEPEIFADALSQAQRDREGARA